MEVDNNEARIHTQRLYAKAMYISAHQKKQYLCAYTP